MIFIINDMAYHVVPEVKFRLETATRASPVCNDKNKGNDWFIYSKR